jgi:DNA-directed RNA polymerase subunit RPC12/RpoP
MSHWMLTCSTCSKEFTHSLIPEKHISAELDLIHKPEFPTEGMELDCPYCGKPGTYQRHDLRYRPTGLMRLAHLL